MAKRIWIPALLALALAGCADFGYARARYERRFSFEHDALAFPNELIWSYDVDERGEWHAEARSPAPTYTHRCFVLARTARQFFQHARFDEAQPVPDDEVLRELVRRVVGTSPRVRRPEAERIVIPGYANLRALSEARATLLREEIGGPLWSYVERGNWRMVIPFSRAHQAETAEDLMEALDRRRPAVLHLVRFPRIAINHAVLVYDYEDAGAEVRFEVYDPNAPAGPATLSYERGSRSFRLGRNSYFEGGRVDAYEIYHRPWY
jgi:hypothetical protein